MSSRPVISIAEMERWRADWDVEQEALPSYLQTHAFREVFFAGRWLFEQLMAAGLQQETAYEVSFAHGQYCAMGGDPWVHAQRLYGEAIDGRPARAGVVLAERLLSESGLAGDLRALVEHLLDKGIGPEEFESMLDRWREDPRYPPEESAFPLPDDHFPDSVIDRTLAFYAQRWKARKAR